jgi:hypothetical protein
MKNKPSALVNFQWIFFLLLIGVVAYIIGEFYLPVISSFAAGIFSVSIIMLLWHYADDMILGDVDTKKEIIDKQNIAYALYTIGLIILIAVAYLAAFAVFFTLAR